MKVTELKEHLRRLNKAVSGTKSVLQDRLKEALSEAEPVPLTPVVPKTVAVPSADDDEDELLEQELNSGPSGWGSRVGRGGRDEDEEEFTFATEEDLQLGQEVTGEVRA